MAALHGSNRDCRIFALALQPFVSAFVTVELAALLIPPWRHLLPQAGAKREPEEESPSFAAKEEEPKKERTPRRIATSSAGKQ